MMYFAANKDTEIAGIGVATDDVIMVEDDGESAEVILTINGDDVTMTREEFQSNVLNSDAFEQLDEFDIEEETDQDMLSEMLGLEEGDESVIDENGDLMVENTVDTKEILSKILETGQVRDILTEAIEGGAYNEAGVGAGLKALVKKFGGTIKRVKKVVGGKVVSVFKRIGGRKKKLSSKQRSALMRIRSKAHSGMARMKLRKSLRKAAQLR